MAEEYYRSRYTGEQIDEALGKAMQYKPLTVATDKKLGGVQPVTADRDMVQEVGITPDGKLYTKPTTATGALGLDETLTSERMAAPAKVVGDTLAECGNALKGYASGEIVRVDDVSPVAHKAAVKVGRGRNILPVPYYDNVKDINGVTVTANEDGSITINGTSTAAVGFLVFNGSMPLHGNYTLSGVTNPEGATSTHYLQPYIDDQFLTTVVNGSRTYEFDGNLTQLSLYVKAGFTFDNVVVYPQLEAGDTATAYEPYVDPATVTLTRCGKNLIPFPYVDGDVGDEYTNAGITYTVNADKSITANGTATTNSYFRLCNVGFGEAYIYENNTTGDFACLDCQYDDNNSFTFIMILKGSTVTNKVYHPQVEQGAKVTAWESPKDRLAYTPDANGLCMVDSVAPVMTLCSDAAVTIEAEYNRDTNKALEDVSADVKELDRVVAEMIENGTSGVSIDENGGLVIVLGGAKNG